MNKFKEVKKLINAEEVIEKYLGQPRKRTRTTIWYLSPFRSEKTPSFVVSDKGIHDFGDSRHYDIISFVSRYFNVDSLEALKILCADFNLSLAEEEQLNKEQYKELLRKREQEKQHRENVEKWYNKEMQKLCNEILENKKYINTLKSTTYFEALSILYDKQQKLDYKYEIYTNTDKERLYLER